jgi:hypothetical protein
MMENVLKKDEAVLKKGIAGKQASVGGRGRLGASAQKCGVHLTSCSRPPYWLN